MEAKDTVMSEEELQAGYCEGCYDVEYLIRRQAEITWKAREPEIAEAKKVGIKEIEEWYASHL